MSEELSLAEKSKQQLSKAEMGITAGLPLDVSEGGIDELRRGVQLLMDMESIRQLKHAYFRCIDTANFEELAELFHDDVFVHFIGGNYEWKLQGKEQYLESVRAAFTSEARAYNEMICGVAKGVSRTKRSPRWHRRRES